MLTLYTNPMSRGRIARWMLEEVGAPYEVRQLAYGDEMKEALRGLNPMGKVPTLVHDHRVITEAAAICVYLADAFPEAGLAPQGPRADYYRWLFFAAGPIEQAVTAKAMGLLAPADKARSVGYGSYDEVIDAFDDWFSTHDYVTENRFTAADVYLGAQASWGLMFGTIPARDSLKAYAARVTGRPAYLRASALDDADMPPRK